MSVDSLRIEDIFRGTEAEVVNHFANKNKTITQLQGAVGTLAVSTDTNRVMIFTGPTTAGTHTRGDFSWNTFSTNTTYTLDDSVVAQYNPVMWFDAAHVSDEYLGGSEGLLRDNLKSEHIADLPTRPLILSASSNSGQEQNYGDWHVQSQTYASWNSFPGGTSYQYGLKVNPNKFFRHNQDMSIWFTAATGSDHAMYANGAWYSDSSPSADKIEDRAAAVPAGWRVGQTASALGWATANGGSIVHRDGHKYLRTDNTNNGAGPHACNSFSAESGQEFPFGTTCFQIARKSPGYDGPSVPLVAKSGFGDTQMDIASAGNAYTMGAGVPGSFDEVNGRGFATWRNYSSYSTANNHFYHSKSTGLPTSNFAGSGYIPAWGYYPSQRAQIHDTSVGGASGVGTLTYDYNSFKAELAANAFTNLAGNIIEIDNNNMPNNIEVGTDQYGNSTPANDFHVLASGDKPIGWQTFYVPKWDEPQMRVFPYGAGIEQRGSFLEEKLNGFGQTKFRNDYQNYMLRPSVDAHDGFDGSGYSVRSIGANHMYDKTKGRGILWQAGNIQGSGGFGGWGQDAVYTLANTGLKQYQMDIAETIILPTPGTFAAYKTMVANIEGYLAAKYGIQQDCSLNVPA